MADIRRVQALIKNEKGSAVVILALTMSVLAGATALVADVGVAYVTQQRLSVVADAASLAGGQELHLGSTQARAAALANAARNGISSEKMQVSVGQNNQSLSVRVMAPMYSFFGQVLGFRGGELAAAAKVVRGAPTARTGLAPLAIQEQDFSFGERYTLKFGAGENKNAGLGPGNFGILALGGPGANRYGNNLTNGYPGLIEIGDVLDTQTGNISGATRKAIKERFARCREKCPGDLCSHENVTPDCPRLLIVPVFHPPQNSKKQVKSIVVSGFAAFHVETIPGSGRNSFITGRFIRIHSGGPVDVGGSDFGVSGTKMVE